MLPYVVVLPLWLVALIAEGVDRNIYCKGPGDQHFTSPSSRRAWIEISQRRTNWRD